MVMASGSRLVGVAVLNERELLGHPRGRWAAGEPDPLARQVRLVGVPGASGDVGQGHPPGTSSGDQQRSAALEASDPLELLRCQPYLGAQQASQVPPAVAD